jgi:hypothetical protein
MLRKIYMIAVGDRVVAEAIALEVDTHKTSDIFVMGIGPDDTITNYLCGWHISVADNAMMISKFENEGVLLTVYDGFYATGVLNELDMHIIEQEG